MYVPVEDTCLDTAPPSTPGCKLTWNSLRGLNVGGGDANRFLLRRLGSR
jgi:hypothetical protein